MSNLAKYKSFSEDVVETARKIIDAAESGDFVTIPEGTSRWRILPLPSDSPLSEPWLVVYEHWLTDGSGKRVRFACPKLAKAGACPVCKERDRLFKTNNPVDRAAASELRAQRKVYMVVISRDNEELGPRIMNVGKKIHDQLLNLMKKCQVDLADPLEGVDFEIERTGTKKDNTEYEVDPVMHKGSVVKSPLCEDEDAAIAWLEDQPDISKFFTIDTDKMEYVLDGGSVKDYKPVESGSNKQVESTRRAQKQLPSGRKKEPAAREMTDQDFKADSFDEDDIPF